MPSATATAIPFEPSDGCRGIMAPWKSWLASLRPFSECCPIETVSSVGIRQHALALGGRADVRGVERETGEGEASHQVAQHGRDLVPDQVVHDRELAADQQSCREQEHVHDGML